MAPLAANAAATDTTTTKSNNNLFRGNPLTNGALEQLRIWEQAEADNIRYGGELERGDAGNRGQISAYPTLLVPILRVARDLETVRTAVGGGNSKDNTNSSRDRRSYPDALAILQQPAYQKIAFKRTFNAFADNIYYSDPDRANLYLGGGGMSVCMYSTSFV